MLNKVYLPNVNRLPICSGYEGMKAIQYSVNKALAVHVMEYQYCTNAIPIQYQCHLFGGMGKNNQNAPNPCTSHKNFAIYIYCLLVSE